MGWHRFKLLLHAPAIVKTFNVKTACAYRVVRNFGFEVVLGEFMIEWASPCLMEDSNAFFDLETPDEEN